MVYLCALFARSLRIYLTPTGKIPYLLFHPLSLMCTHALRQGHEEGTSEKGWEGIGDIDFTTKWQTFETIVTVSPEFNGMWSIAFNLNAYDKNPVVYYIDDISWSESRKLH